MNTSRTTSNRFSLVKFFVFTYLCAWLFWLFPLLTSRNILRFRGSPFLFLLAGSLAPLLMAFVAKYIDGGVPAMREFAMRSLRIRIRPVYLLASLLLIPALGYLAIILFAHMGGPKPKLIIHASQIPLVFVELFLLGGSINEEFGWAYAIDRLHSRLALLPAAILLGVIWGFWHLPLFFISASGLTQSFIPFWAFLMFAVSLRVLFVWAYMGTGRSIMATLLFHTSTNLTFNLYFIVDMSKSRDERGYIILALLTFTIAVVTTLVSPLYRSRSAANT